MYFSLEEKSQIYLHVKIVRGEIMKVMTCILYIMLLLLLTACRCTSIPHEEYNALPSENELPQVPNCAADGLGCKQFNPDL